MGNLAIKTDKEYTLADYFSWPEDERWEIIDGVAYMQATPLEVHQRVSGELYRQFANYLIDKSCRVYAAPFSVWFPKENDIEDKIKNVVEPDLVVICDKSKIDRRGCKGAPDLVIEILSPSNNKKERLKKFNLYERNGVKEYWLVDPEDKMVEVFRLSDKGEYGRPNIYDEKDKIKVGVFPDLEIDPELIFREI